MQVSLFYICTNNYTPQLLQCQSYLLSADPFIMYVIPRYSYIVYCNHVYIDYAYVCHNILFICLLFVVDHVFYILIVAYVLCNISRSNF